MLLDWSIVCLGLGLDLLACGHVNGFLEDGPNAMTDTD
jgi:hypothetical protein